ncbi:MAG TPA: hypothetical protein ENJ91_01965 [Rhodobacteraceae bacterium]|nr:hypothetical protein [Paracoccaceae bacterium]
MRRISVSIITAVMIAGAAQSDDLGVFNDYPTEARADYVFACMEVNGRTREALSRCSCSIDVIASILTYDDYVSAETVLRMLQTSGEKTTLFRSTAISKGAVQELRRAQAEAEIRCF